MPQDLITELENGIRMLNSQLSIEQDPIKADLIHQHIRSHKATIQALRNLLTPANS